MRVSRAGYRTYSEIDYELGLLGSLAAAGIPVPVPVLQRTGERFFTVSAPEGERPIALLSWVEGQPLGRQMTIADGNEAGRLLGRLQIAARGFAPAWIKRVDTVARIERQMPFIDNVAPPGSAARQSFDVGLEAVRHYFAASAAAELPIGPAHGDFQYANVLKSSDGQLWAVDFDECGVDILVKDLVTFEWRARLERISQAVLDAFLDGYLAERPMSADERSALPLLRVARDLYLLVSYAAYIDRIGPVAGFEQESRLLELLAEDLQSAGLVR